MNYKVNIEMKTKLIKNVKCYTRIDCKIRAEMKFNLLKISKSYTMN